MASRSLPDYIEEERGLARATGNTGAVTLIQRFGSAPNLNVHFHMIFLDGVYLPAGDSPPVFRHLPAPRSADSSLAPQPPARGGAYGLARHDCL
jgi:hypothetical protein